jgi:glycosyltransferase involved in cell wall biosynthesis
MLPSLSIHSTSSTRVKILLKVLFQNHTVRRFNEGLISGLRDMGHQVDAFWHKHVFDSLWELGTPAIRPMAHSILDVKNFGGPAKESEVIHLNDPLDGELGVVAKIERRPLVVTLHGTPVDHREGAGGGMKGILTYRLRYAYLSLLHDLGARVTVQSQFCARSLWSYSHIPARVIYNGVETDVFTPGRQRGYLQGALGIPSTNKVVLWVGRGHQIKDPFTFLTAAEAVARKRSDTSFVMLLWYKGPLDDQIEDFVKGSEFLRRSLHFVRKIPWTQMPEAYASSDLVVHTSPREGFGNAVSEAMSSGRAVIAADRGGPSEYIQDGGLLFKSGDRDDLREKMECLLSDDGRRKGLGESARRIACANLSWDRAAAEYSEVYGLG